MFAVGCILLLMDKYMDKQMHGHRDVAHFNVPIVDLVGE